MDKKIFFSAAALMCMVFTATSVLATERKESTTTSETASLQFDERAPAESTSQSSDRVLDETSSTVKDSSSETVAEERQNELPQERAHKGNIIDVRWGRVFWLFFKDSGTLRFSGGGTIGTWDYSP